MAGLDSRTKALICIAVSTLVIFLEDPLPLSILAAASCMYALAGGRFRVLLFSYAAIVVMSFLSIGFGVMMASFVPVLKGFSSSYYIIPFLRVMIMVNVILVLALSSRLMDLLTALKSVRLPLFIYLPVAVMVRFIPTFIDDIRQIRDSLKTMGYSVNPVAMTAHPFLMTRLLFAPAVFRALRSADDLAMAAELKGVGVAKKIKPYRTSRFDGADYKLMLFSFMILAASVFLEFGKKVFI